jgi:AmmeMemoRadiSam system protein A
MVRQALVARLVEGREPEHDTDRPALLQPGAAFVTLRRREDGELRGCRGEVLARSPLAKAATRTAVATALDDPRFAPVTGDELDDLHIEISVLTPMTPIRPEEVEVGRHGLMIRFGPYVGLLLPQVPVDHGWDRDRYLQGICQKAGLPLHTWKDPDAELYAFEAQVWGEDEDEE